MSRARKGATPIVMTRLARLRNLLVNARRKEGAQLGPFIVPANFRARFLGCESAVPAEPDHAAEKPV